MLRYIVLLIALGAGGGAAYIAAQSTAPNSDTVVTTPAAAEMASVLVAARDVPRGGQVTVDALRWQQWPAEAVPTTFIKRTERPEALNEITGHFANRPISAGEPIADRAFSQEPKGFLAATLAPGKRAVAINVNAQSTAGGFILPNDRVDVLHTLKDVRNREATDVRTRAILKDVRVLAIDQTTQDTESGTVVGKTATLELTETQVEAVTAAEATGTISLSLRPLDEAPGEASMETLRPTKTIRVRRGVSTEDVEIN